MKLSKRWKTVALLSAVMFTRLAGAVTPAEDEEKKCKKPKFRDFAPVALSEVAPESEISFHVSHDADPLSVISTAKGEKMVVKVENKKTFLLAKAKLPATVRDGFARIHVAANALEGGCQGQDGWLIKIRDGEAHATTAPDQTRH